jgi:hypothetical protein
VGLEVLVHDRGEGSFELGTELTEKVYEGVSATRFGTKLRLARDKEEEGTSFRKIS